MAKKLQDLELQWAFEDLIQSQTMKLEDCGATLAEQIEWLDSLIDRVERRRCNLILGMNDDE